MFGRPYRQISTLWAHRHLPQDDHLCFQQRSLSIVNRNGRAVVREDDGHSGFVIGWDWVAEGRGWEAESVCAISAVIMMLIAVGLSRMSGHVDGELGLESVVFDGLESL